MYKSLWICLGMFWLVSTSVIAQDSQTEESKVLAVINQLFDGMRESDTTKVRMCFHSEARMQTIMQNPKTKATRLHTEVGIERFLKQIATPHDEIYDERLKNPEVRIDGALATVWVPYRFYIGKTFSHCGVNAFQLIFNGDKWQITQIIDTHYREGCD